MISSSTRQRLLWLILFAVAMAELEATVVVYLRELYYPDGFRFPLVMLGGRSALLEIGREGSTVVMLVAVGRLAAADPWRRFSGFLLAFGVWDLFYYFWLWVQIGWPPSLLSPDILFLIPLPWVGPVLSAALIALVMCVAGLVIEHLRDQQRTIKVGAAGWGITVLSALGLLVVFMWDGPRVLKGAMPRPFPWLAYLLFLLPAVVVAVLTARRARRGDPPPLSQQGPPRPQRP